MNRFCFTITFLLMAAGALAAGAPAHKLIEARDGSGIIGYKDTPLQPWSGFHTHDPDRPAPPRVDPGPETPPAPVPADATVLFGGKAIDAWVPAAEWAIKDGVLTAGKGFLTTKEEYGDCQLHLEWATPEKLSDNIMNRGNNGVMMLGLFEVQIFDSYYTKLYPDGQAASVYGQTPPRVNVSRKPGQWQTYDIMVTAPVIKDGKVLKPARITMLHNGVLVHLNQEVYGDTPHAGLASYKNAKERGPISLMGHNEPVRFRNIWIRKLDLAEKKAVPEPAKK